MNIKKSVWSLLLAAACQGAMAQAGGGLGANAGDIQISLVLGSSNMFNQSTSAYLLPKYDNTSTSPGIGLGTSNSKQSEDPSYYLNLGSVGSSSLVNMAGIQARYYLSSNLDVNAMFAMNISATPKKDYEEGDATIPYMVIPQQRYIEGRLSTNWMASIGANYHFNTSSERVTPYAGVALGGQMGRIQTTTPYTGYVGITEGEDFDYDYDDYDQGYDGTQSVLYTPQSRAGQIYALQGSLILGVECVLVKGLVLGIEVAPCAYQHSVIEIMPKGFQTYRAVHDNVKIFASPNLKLGFRF